ncbi:roadblock/LC7 domain-containing protein [Tepidiforma flava]|uniref:Roadblock/LC7 domain-containing protein n=1 Tax=Tepidiforma flava TaxID=3004094 RepID=A0ABY7M4L5_9CHLR|nr:roadblock/LC7 domain-containing protein [Tepidiforma flava]WBL34918.1 roadblock/LC7 domain-containing protein [Tepidiforma flava]
MQPAEPLSRETASRIAQAVRHVEGVRSVTVCGPEGQPLAAVNEPDPARAAALASFVALRAEALPTDGDLRGMGRQLAGSRFLQAAISGGPAEAAILPLQGAYLCITHAPGRGQAIAAALQPIIRRFGATPSARS